LLSHEATGVKEPSVSKSCGNYRELSGHKTGLSFGVGLWVLHINVLFPSRSALIIWKIPANCLSARDV